MLPLQFVWHPSSTVTYPVSSLIHCQRMRTTGMTGFLQLSLPCVMRVLSTLCNITKMPLQTHDTKLSLPKQLERIYMIAFPLPFPSVTSSLPLSLFIPLVRYWYLPSSLRAYSVGKHSAKLKVWIPQFQSGFSFPWQNNWRYHDRPWLLVCRTCSLSLIMCVSLFRKN